MLRSLVVLTCAAVLCLPSGARAQEPVAPADTVPEEAVRVLLDCADFFCDFDFFRTDIPWVNYVRERQDAQVHVLITTQQTGGGGREFTLAFLGQRRFAAQDQTLRYTSAQTATEVEVRQGLAGAIKRGLVPYINQTALADRLRISIAPPAEDAAAGTPAADPWNFWTFRVSGRGFFNGESRFDSNSLSGAFSADRVTEQWKINTALNARYSESNFEISAERTVTNIQRNYGATALVVRSLGPHWSAGGRASLTSSTFLNQDLTVALAPAIEYNLFPYSESTRRQLTLQYAAGVTRFDYKEETIFDEATETLPNHSLITSLSVKQPWGTVSGSISGAQYLHDLERYRLTLFNRLDVRLFKGFSLDVFGNIALIRDQIYLPAGGATEEEILLRQRQLATDFDYFASVGISYRFGSIFNNVVNPRFGGSSGGVVFIN